MNKGLGRSGLDTPLGYDGGLLFLLHELLIVFPTDKVKAGKRFWDFHKRGSRHLIHDANMRLLTAP